MKLRPVGKSLDKRSSQSAISIALRYINMKMCRVVLANILNVPKIRNIFEMSKFCRIFEAACEISDAPGVIKSNKEAVSMVYNVSSERHFTKRLLFFLAAKITSSAGFKKNVVYLAKMAGEIGDFVCSPYFDHSAHPSPRIDGMCQQTSAASEITLRLWPRMA
jgi:hypothetical protein